MLAFTRALTLSALLVSTVPVSAQEVAFPASSKFGMIPFEGSEAASAFSGFVNPKTSASVTIMEMPSEAYDPVIQAMTDPDRLATRGIVAESTEEVSFGELTGQRIKGTQRFQGREIPKCIVVLRGRSATAMFAAQMPRGVDENACALIAGIEERAAPSEDERIAALPFRFGSVEGLRVDSVLMGNTVTLKPKGVAAEGRTLTPYMVVASGTTPASVPDAEREAYATRLFKTRPGFENVQISQTEPVEIGGLSGIRIVSDAVSTTSPKYDQADVHFEQTLLFADRTLLVGILIVPGDDRAKHIARFRAALATASLRDAP